MYEELISYIIDGYDNNHLQKIVNLKQIKIQGICDVNDKTRHIILNNLKTKNNLFEIYKSWSSRKNKEFELIDIDRDKFEKIMTGSIVSNKQVEFVSNYLYKMVINEGIEDTLNFWGNNKERFEELKLGKTSKIEVIRDKRQQTGAIEDKHLNQMDKLIKKQEKEHKNWQIIEKKLNKQLKKSNEEVLSLQKEVKINQNKYDTKLEELRKKLIKDEKESAELVNLRDYKKKVDLELINIKEANKTFQQENIKKNEMIKSLQFTIDRSTKEINKLNKTVLESKNSSNDYNKISNNYDVNIEKKKNGLDSIDTSFKNLENTSQLVVVEKNNDSKNDYTEIKNKKILVFGDITGLDYDASLFEIYTSNLMPKDIMVFIEEDYREIWLIKYRFPKKFQRSQVMKRFNKVNVINNFIELEGVYRNEL